MAKITLHPYFHPTMQIPFPLDGKEIDFTVDGDTILEDLMVMTEEDFFEKAVKAGHNLELQINVIWNVKDFKKALSPNDKVSQHFVEGESFGVYGDIMPAQKPQLTGLNKKSNRLLMTVGALGKRFFAICVLYIMAYKIMLNQRLIKVEHREGFLLFAGIIAAFIASGLDYYQDGKYCPWSDQALMKSLLLWTGLGVVGIAGMIAGMTMLPLACFTPIASAAWLGIETAGYSPSEWHVLLPVFVGIPFLDPKKGGGHPLPDSPVFLIGLFGAAGGCLMVSHFKCLCAEAWRDRIAKPLHAEELGELIHEELADGIVERTYLMYHGTSLASAKRIQEEGFKTSERGMLGEGVYLTRDLRRTRRFIRREGGGPGAIVKCHVHVGRVIRITKGHPRQYDWHQHGYDSAWVPSNSDMVQTGLSENCIHDPRRIQVMEVCSIPETDAAWASISSYM